MLIIISSKESKDLSYINHMQQRKQDFQYFIFRKRKYMINKNGTKCTKENVIKSDIKTSHDKIRLQTLK